MYSYSYKDNNYSKHDIANKHSVVMLHLTRCILCQSSLHVSDDAMSRRMTEHKLSATYYNIDVSATCLSYIVS
jgi:hypothetical protein